MYEINIHKSAQKNLKKSPKHIQKKAFVCITHLRELGMSEFPFEVDTIKGNYKKFKYMEAKLTDDYRIIFRKEGNCFCVRFAGTHNQLGTG